MRPQRAAVDQCDGAVGVSNREHSAVWPQRVARRDEAGGLALAGLSGVEWAAKAAGAGEIPDQYVAVLGGGVEGSAVAADGESGDLAGVALERLAGRRALDVPDDHALVLAGRDGGPPVSAEGGLHDRPVVAPGGGPDVAPDEVEEAHRAVAAADQHRAVVRAQRRLIGADRQLPKRAQRAGIADDGGAAREVRHQAPAVVRDDQRLAAEAAEAAGHRRGAPVRPRPGEGPPAARVEALDGGGAMRAVDDGEQRAPVRREAQIVDVPILGGGQSSEHAPA